MMTIIRGNKKRDSGAIAAKDKDRFNKNNKNIMLHNLLMSRMQRRDFCFESIKHKIYVLYLSIELFQSFQSIFSDFIACGF
jgi:hypothetical protein